MKTLFIDTHLWDIVIVLYEDGKVVDKREVINKKNNSEYIFPTLVDLIDGINLDEIIVVTGPGSFTGVRLGVTIAKTLAYTLNIPIKTITALECMAISNKALSVAFSDLNGYYVGHFDDRMQLKEDYCYMDVDKFLDTNKDNHICVNWHLDFEAIYNFVNSKKSENPHAIKPIYVKKIGVEK